MLKIYSVAALLAFAGGAFAQTSSAPGTPPYTNPSVAPSDTPAVTPSQTPAVAPSEAPAVTPSQTPSTASSPSTTIPGPVKPPAAVGGLSKCENMLGTDKDLCLQQERAGTGGTAR